MTISLEALARRAWEADRRDIFPAGWEDYLPIVTAVLGMVRDRWADDLAIDDDMERFAQVVAIRMIDEILGTGQ